MKWTSGISGYVEISLWGTNPERVINMALSRGISIWDIRLAEDKHYQLKVSLGGYKALRLLVRSSSCKVKIIKKKGMPFFLMRAKRRKVLVLGTFFFCLALYLLSSFVWIIEVKGNELVSTELILAKAEEYGLKKGVHLASFEKNKIAEKLLSEFTQLAWVGIEVQGTKIVIEVAEKTFPSTDEENMPGNLIAREDGIIEELLVLKGSPQVQEGDRVKKGQVLILGLVYPEIIISETGELCPSGEPQIVRAKGVVRARVRRSNVEKCALREKLIWDTGIEKSVVVLKFRDKEIYLKGTKEIPFSNYRMVRQAKPLFVYKGRNLLGPVELISVVYKEQICEIRDWGIEGAYQEAARRTQDFLWSQLPADYKIISQSFEPVTVKEKGVVAVRYVLETIEDIGIYQQYAQ
ncbi:MAG: sporulation protein YqfD [Clostridia bacterium]|jgi:similar to stage IV sporulation protein|nr:sporulation protein YqfD [Clostridia bacterium]